MYKRLSILLIAALGLMIFAAACAGKPAANQFATSPAVAPQSTKGAASGLKITPPAGNSGKAAQTPAKAAQPTNTTAANVQSNNAPAAEGGEGGVEAALVTYSDAKQGFAIGHPGTWTQDPSVTSGVKFMGGDDSMILQFVTPPAGTDAMTYAKNDVSTVAGLFPEFKQIDIKASTEVKNAIILGFTANGTSAVTGKSFTAHNERYYMPLADGRIAVLTVYGPDNHYDREGVRDIALTFKLTK